MDARGQALPYVVLQGGEICAPGASSHAPLCRALRSVLRTRELIRRTAGWQRWYLLIDLAVAIKCFGVGCSYLVVIGDLMPEAMHQLAPAATLLHQVCGLTQRRSRRLLSTASQCAH